MNQIIPVGKGILIAAGEHMTESKAHYMIEAWRERMPDVPMFIIADAQVVLLDGGVSMFEFTGDVSPTVIAEFQRWWEEVNRA